MERSTADLIGPPLSVFDTKDDHSWVLGQVLLWHLCPDLGAREVPCGGVLAVVRSSPMSLPRLTWYSTHGFSLLEYFRDLLGFPTLLRLAVDFLPSKQAPAGPGSVSTAGVPQPAPSAFAGRDGVAIVPSRSQEMA